MTQRRQDADQIVASYRQGAVLKDVGAQFGISYERVRQIIVAFERRTGEQVKRHPTGLPPGTGLALRIIWKCRGCGEERDLTPYQYKNAPIFCAGCATAGRVSADFLEDVIQKKLAGVSWYRLALEAGYHFNSISCLAQQVYVYLRRHGDAETISRIWPVIPRWLHRYDSPQHALAVMRR